MGSTGSKEIKQHKDSPRNLKQSVKRHRTELCKFIDPRFGLVEEMITLSVLSRPDSHIVQSKHTVTEQNNQIIDFVLKKPSKETHIFLQALSATYQQHVVNYILYETDCSELEKRPLSDEEIARLNTNLRLLLDHVNVYILVYDLYSNGCITRWQKEHLTQKNFSSMEQVSELIDILVRRSFADFKLFLDILDNTGHQHVSRVLREGGVVMPIRASVSPSSSSSMSDISIESDVIKKAIWLLEEADEEETNKIKELIILKENGMRLVEVGSGSVKLLLWCCELFHLERLRQWLVTKRMQEVLVALFSRLLGISQDVNLLVDIDWRKKDYERSVEYFNGRTADVTDGNGKMNVKSDIIQTDTLPLELLELILMKAAVGIQDRFQVCLLLRHRADELTLATLFHVCRKWWYVITNRKWSRRCLRQAFRSKSTIMPLELMKAVVIFRNELKTQPRDSRKADIEVFTKVSAVCRHWHKSIATCRDISRRQIKRQLKYRPQLLKVVPVKGSRLRGVTYCDGMLFAVLDDTLTAFDGDTMKELKTYDIRTLFDINDQYLEYYIIRDIVSCSDTMNLFVTNYTVDIFRVNISSINNININKFVQHEGGVESMSLTRRRLLVTPDYNEDKINSLVVYDVVSGERLQSVQLPTFMRPTHSIERTNNVFIVSHVGESRDHRGVSEVNSEGHVTRAYNGLLHVPCYLSLKSLGRVLVLDGKWKVLLLSGELKYERVLVDMQQLDDKQTTTEQTSRTLTSLISPLFPLWRRMCYDKKTRRLFVRVSYNEREIGGEILILKC